MANEREYSVKITADASGFQAAFKAASGLVGEFSAGLKDGFREGLAEVEKSTAGVKRFGDEAEKAGGKSLSSFESIALKVTGIVGALDLASKAMSAIGGAIEGVFAGIDRGGMFDDLSKRIGVSVESLSSLELAAQAGGVSLDSLGTGMQVLSRNMAEAAGGSKEAQAGFAAFGIAVADANGNLKSGEEVLLQIADRFAGAEDGAAKTAAAMDLLGKSGTQLIPFLNEGAAGLQKWQQLSSDLGLTLTAELAGAMDRIGDSMLVVGAVATGVQNQLAIGMAPALVALSDAAVDLVRNLGIADGGVRDFGATIGSAVVQGVDAALGALNTFIETVYSLGLGDALLQVFGAAFSALEDMAAAQGRVIGLKFVQSFAAAVDSLIDSIPGLMLLDKPFTNLAQGSIDEATAQVRALADSFSNLGQGSPELAKVSSALEAARARLAQFNPAVQENDAHVNAWKASMQGAANTLPVVAKGTDAAAAAATKAADAIEKLRERFAEQIRTQTEAVEKMQGQNEALQQIIDGNLSAADAQKVLNDATGEAAAVAAIAAGATAKQAAELGNLAIDAAQAAQANRALNATRAAQVDTGYLREERDILEQVLAGTKDRITAEHELAVLRERRKNVDADIAENLVTERELTDKSREAYDEMGKSAVDAWKGIDDAFQQTLDGLINGTLDMQDIWKSFTLGLLKDFATSMGGVSGILGKVFDGFKGLTDGTGSVGDLLKGLGGGTDRFVISAGTPNERVDYGAVSGAAVQGGATAYSLFQPTDDTKLEGLIAKGTESGVINASNAIGQVVGTIAGAVLSIYLGPLGGIVGAAIGSALSGLIAGSVNRETFLTGKYTGFVGFQQTFDPFHAWLTDLVLNLPTLGLAMRKGAEAVLDESETFAALQSKYGDITVRSGGPKDVYRNNLTGSETARSRGFTDGQVDLTEGATASIFGQISKDELSQDSGRLGEAMGQIMAEFLSRGLEEGADFEPMFDKLREFAHEAGIDLFSSMRMLKDVFADSMSAAMTWAHMDPLAAAAQGARAYAEALVGATEVFEGDFPAGVNTTAIALRYMTKDGVNAFGELDDAAKDTLLNLSDDTELTMTTVQRLVEQGFTIDDEAFKEALQSIAQSAQFIGQNSAAFFDGPSVFAGIESMGQKLRDTIKQAVISTGTEQLFDKTRIAESFSPVYEVLDKLKAGDFNLLDASGNASFRDEMVTAIAAGKANLQEYIPQLRALRDAAEEVDKAIEEALKPSTEEAFWQNISETFKSNEEAINGMAEGMFEVAVQAERAGAGLGQQATRDAMSAKVDEGIFTATQAAVSTTAGESPEAQRLAALTTEFQFKVKAALKDGIVSAAELADLTALKQKMHDAGKEVADGISESTAALDDLFKADRLKEAIDAAVGTLKDAVGGASGSMFDAIKNGGSTAEGVKAFGESFRSSVRDNVLQGMQEALVQSVVMEGALATLMGQMKQAVSVALSDGFIDADEQAFIDGLAKGIGTATDSALTALEPTLNTLGGIAQTVAGNTDKAEAKVDDLDKSTKNASYGVDEMARRAARNLEQVGDAVPPDTLNTIKDGMGSLGEALGKEGGTGAIAEGVGALKDALGGAGSGPAAEIGAGIGALKDALGPVSAGAGDEMKSGLEALRAAFGPDAKPEDIGAGLEKIKGALGGVNGGGVVDAADALKGALGATGATQAALEAAAAMGDQLTPNIDDVAGALQNGFKNGLGEAEKAARDLATALGSFKLPGAASGGTFAGGMAVVGESGPEVVTALAGGGFHVEPITRAQMNSLLGAGAPGFENGGALIPIHVRGGGRPHVPPPPGTHPPSKNPDASGEDVTLNVSFNFDSALDDFFRGGTRKDLRDALAETTGEGILQGMMEAMLQKAGLEAFQEEMASTIEKAMEDGTISASELEGIEKMGKDFKAKLVDMADELGPAFKTIAEAFGIDIGQEVTDAITPAAQTAKDLIGGSLRSALRDPANLNYETFSASLRQAVYGNIVDGMVDAFIDAAVIQGALAPMLAIITAQFTNLGAAIAAGSAEGIAAASAIILTEVGKIANIIDDPAFKAAIQTLLDLGHDVAQGLGLDLNVATEGVNNAADGFQNAADAAANACTGECAAEQKLVTSNEKLITLNSSGRTGGVTDSHYEDIPSPPDVGGPDRSFPDTYGGGNWRYGDEDWHKSRAWHRERARARARRGGNGHTYYDPDIPQMAEGGIVTGPTFALIGEAGPEAVIPLSGAQSESALVSEIRALREELRNHGDKTVSALQSDRHTEVKMNEQTLIDAWTSAKRIADKAGIQFGA